MRHIKIHARLNVFQTHEALILVQLMNMKSRVRIFDIFGIPIYWEYATGGDVDKGYLHAFDIINYMDKEDQEKYLEGYGILYRVSLEGSMRLATIGDLFMQFYESFQYFDYPYPFGVYIFVDEKRYLSVEKIRETR